MIESMIFVNLPVSDLAASRAFYEAIGAMNEPKFSDDSAACMKVSETIFFMLLTPGKYRDFTPLPIADARAASAVILCLSRASRDAVDRTIEAGVAAGGSADPARPQDYGVMFGRSLLDPDGHHLEFMWMDPAAADQGAAALEQA